MLRTDDKKRILGMHKPASSQTTTVECFNMVAECMTLLQDYADTIASLTEQLKVSTNATEIKACLSEIQLLSDKMQQMRDSFASVAVRNPPYPENTFA